jgi:hypothetical protein
VRTPRAATASARPRKGCRSPAVPAVAKTTCCGGAGVNAVGQVGHEDRDETRSGREDTAVQGRSQRGAGVPGAMWWNGVRGACPAPPSRGRFE